MADVMLPWAAYKQPIVCEFDNPFWKPWLYPEIFIQFEPVVIEVRSEPLLAPVPLPASFWLLFVGLLFLVKRNGRFR